MASISSPTAAGSSPLLYRSALATDFTADGAFGHYRTLYAGGTLLGSIAVLRYTAERAHGVIDICEMSALAQEVDSLCHPSDWSQP